MVSCNLQHEWMQNADEWEKSVYHDVNMLEDEGQILDQGEDNFIHVHDDIDEWCDYIFMNLMYFES